MLNRFLLILMSSLVLAACGGGGGGGGGSSSGGSDSSSDSSEDSFAAKQNSHLPLIENMGWTFDVEGSVEDSTILASPYVGSSTQFALSTEFPDAGDDVSLDQVMSSTKNGVYLHRFDAQNFSIDINETISGVVVSGTINLDNLIIDEATPIAVIADSPSNENVTATMQFDIDVSADAVSIDQSDVQINMVVSPTITNSENEIFETPWGEMVGTRSDVTLRISGRYMVLGLIPVDVNLVVKEVAEYVLGVGLVRRDIEFYWDDNDDVFDDGTLVSSVVLEIKDLVELPLPIVYTLNVGTSVAPDDISVAKSNGAGGRIIFSPDNYSLLNETEFNSSGWASVAEAGNGISYDVSVPDPTDIPDASLSEVIYISDDNGTTELPVAVVLTVDAS